MPELVQHHARGCVSPGEVDDPRLPRVDAARRLRQARAAGELDVTCPVDRRHQRRVRPRLPLPGQPLAARGDEPHRARARQRRSRRRTKQRQAEPTRHPASTTTRDDPTQHRLSDVPHNNFRGGPIENLADSSTRSNGPHRTSMAGRLGRLAQLVRAPALQAGGRRFEPRTAHRERPAGGRSVPGATAPRCATVAAMEALWKLSGLIRVDPAGCDRREMRRHKEAMTALSYDEAISACVAFERRQVAAIAGCRRSPGTDRRRVSTPHR